METQTLTTVTCPNCRNTFQAPIQQIIDAQADPEAKSRLLSGRVNFVVCPHCGFQGALNIPFLYHDADLELALIYMPMEMGRTDIERQKAIGDLTQRVMRQLPPEERKGYLLTPRTFLSQQTLVDALLEKDEETREMVEMQQRRQELIEELREIDPEDGLALAQFVGANDAELDAAFFQILDLYVNIAELQGDTLERDKLGKLQEELLERSSTGMRMTAQREAIEALSENPTRENLIDQLIAADEKAVREALVMVGRRLLDYPFFQALTARIDAAEQTEDNERRDHLIALRKEVQEIRDDVDAMTMAVLEARGVFLRELMMAEDPRELMARRMLEVDNAFFSVLSQNMQSAERAGRSDAVQRLREIADMAIALLNETAPPEVKLVNRLAAAEDDEQVGQILQQESEMVNEDFVALLESARESLQGRDRAQSAQRLQQAIDQAREMLSS